MVFGPKGTFYLQHHMEPPGTEDSLRCTKILRSKWHIRDSDSLVISHYLDRIQLMLAC